MRRVWVLAFAAAMVAGCHRGAPAPAAPARSSFDAARFIVATAQRATSDAQMSQIAIRKGYQREVRDLGRTSVPEERQLAVAISGFARERQLAIPPMEDKRLALLQNLEIVLGPNFDQAYVLAMTQDLDADLQDLGRAANSPDPELRAFAQRVTPAVEAERTRAYAALKAIGGSPFVVAP